MSECVPVIIALATIALVASVIYLAVNYAFTLYENRMLREEIYAGFHHTIGFNESLAKDVEYLESNLRPYEHLSREYGCSNAEELENLIMDLQDKLCKMEADK